MGSRTHYGQPIKKKFEFYTLFQVNDKTFSSYKVGWKYTAGKISGKAEFSSAVIEPSKKVPVIPNTKVVFIPVRNLEEANYVASLLNSSIARLVISSYTIETGISTHVLNYLNIPWFKSDNPNQSKLAKLSQTAHDLKKKFKANNTAEYERQLRETENEIDVLVATFFGITNKELEEIRNTLSILSVGTTDENADEQED